MTIAKARTLLSVLLACATTAYVQAQTPEPKAQTLLRIDFPRKLHSLSASFTSQVYNGRAYAEAWCSSGEEEFKAKRCEVALLNFDDSRVTRNKTCQTSFQAERGVLRSLFLHQERNDTVVLPYLHVLGPDEVRFKFRMLRASTCEFREVALPIDPRVLTEPIILPQILMRDDGSFELFAPSDSCGGARCKLTHDSRGGRIGEPIGYLPADMADRAMFFVHGPEAKTYYAFVGVRVSSPEEDKNSRLFYANETRATELIAFDFDYRQFIDDSHGRFGFCYSSSGDARTFVVNCTQWDRDERILDVAFLLVDTLPIATCNAPGGGILLVSGKCGDLHCENLVFREITLDGSVEFRHVDAIEYPKPSLTDVSDGGDGQVCLTLYSSGSALHLIKKCYPKDLVLRAG